MRTRIRLAAVASLLGVMLTSVPLVPSSAGAAIARPSLAQLQQYISDSIAMGHAPDVTATYPPLSLAATGGEGRIPTTCYSSIASTPFPTSASTRCAFGATRSAHIIYLFGDSNAEMWLPALSAMGSRLHWKIVFTGRANCSAWAFHAHTGTAVCHQFVRQEVAFANRLHARIVIPIGAKVAWHNNKNATIRQLKNEINATLTGLIPSRSRPVLFQMNPQFNAGYTAWNPQTCLTTYASYLRPCESVINNFTFTSTASIALWQVAHVRRIPLVPTQELFCTSAGLCTLFVTSPSGTWLVYANSTQINKYYSNWISTALSQLLKPVLH